MRIAKGFRFELIDTVADSRLRKITQLRPIARPGLFYLSAVQGGVVSSERGRDDGPCMEGCEPPLTSENGPLPAPITALLPCARPELLERTALRPPGSRDARPAPAGASNRNAPRRRPDGAKHRRREPRPQ